MLSQRPAYRRKRAMSIDVGRGHPTAGPGREPLEIDARRLLDATPECLVVAAIDGRVVYANERVRGLSGFGPNELIDHPVDELVVAEVNLSDAIGSIVQGSCRRKEGTEIPLEIHVGEVVGPERRYLVVTLRDTSAVHALETSRFETAAKYEALVEGIPAITYIDPVDENEFSIYVSPQVRDMLGITQEQWLSDHYAWRKHVHPDDVDKAWADYVEAYTNRESLTHEYRMVHEDGHVIWVSDQAFIVRNEDGEPWLIQGVIFDITERKNAEEQVAFLAYHDKLTGLPNRVLFEEMLEASLARARRHELAVGVLYLDLDNFKLVNDSLGHHAGDELLKQLADRLRGCTRETDLVARQGGDEFLLLLSDLERGLGAVPGTEAALLAAESVAARVHEALREPFDLAGVEFYASASIGVSLFPHDAPDAGGLLKNADTAMYRSKRTEPGGSVVFASDGADAFDRLAFTTRLRRAVEQEQWVLHWQPVVDLHDGRIRGAESLIRWRDPNGGLVPPGEFIPVAEELGMIEAVIQLARGLGMIPLAEGIERSEELGFLRAAGCERGQGFLFSRPVPAEEIPALVARG